VEYQQIAAGVFSFVSSTVVPFPRFACWGVSWNGVGGGVLVFVFGTLLGPEATGPGRWFFPLCSGVCLFLVSWLHGSVRVVPSPFFGGGGVRGVWYGVVV
jgi:hypothetical protein